jgi:anti-sigma-K factor RskA
MGPDRAGGAAYNLPVAKVEPTIAPEEEAPPLDPEAIERAYRLHRARRAARERWHREKRWAGFRFWLVLVLVLAVAAVLAARTLGEIERVFGL